MRSPVPMAPTRSAAAAVSSRLSAVFGRRLALVASLVALVAGCGQLPRDPDGTLERVTGTHRVNIGFVSRDGGRLPRERQFVGRLASSLGAVPVLSAGPAEELLARLEEGELDLVVGEFHSSSPWTRRVTFVPPLSGQGEGMVLRAAARNGENAWIAVLHRHSRLIGERE